MRSWMFCKIDILENFAKFTGNCLYQTILTPTEVLLRIFQKFQEHFFYGTPLSDYFLFNFNLLTVLRCFCFRTFQSRSKFLAPEHWLLFLHGVNTIRVKISLVLKKVRNICFIKHINYFHKTLSQDSEYDSSSKFERVLNIPGF